MDLLRKMNSELEACMNLTVASATSDQVFFPQNEMREHLSQLVTSAKLLELFLVEQGHRMQYPNTSEIDNLRQEVLKLRNESQTKEKVLSETLNRVVDWANTTEALHSTQIEALFDLIDDPNDSIHTGNSDSAAKTDSKMSTDETSWWGQLPTNDVNEQDLDI